MGKGGGAWPNDDVIHKPMASVGQDRAVDNALFSWYCCISGKLAQVTRQTRTPSDADDITSCCPDLHAGCMKAAMQAGKKYIVGQLLQVTYH